jgi:hypothetical protein
MFQGYQSIIDIVGHVMFVFKLILRVDEFPLRKIG